MAQAQLLLLAHDDDVGHHGHLAHLVQKIGLPLALQQLLQGKIVIEMILDDALVLVVDENHVRQARGDGLLHDILDGGFPEHRQNFLGHILGRRK